jgi:hypothetical protein
VEGRGCHLHGQHRDPTDLLLLLLLLLQQVAAGLLLLLLLQLLPPLLLVVWCIGQGTYLQALLVMTGWGSLVVLVWWPLPGPPTAGCHYQHPCYSHHPRHLLLLHQARPHPPTPRLHCWDGTPQLRRGLHHCSSRPRLRTALVQRWGGHQQRHLLLHQGLA